MNSVAIPASAPIGALGAEGELVRQAVRGDAEAFAELFRRHGQMAWRLAQAVAANRDAAVSSVATGFVRALQASPRRQTDREAGFRPTVLAAVYRHAIDDARARAANPALPVGAATVAQGARATEGPRGHGRGAADADAVMTAAFRSLPERWRAALWLTEVESIAPERMAAILGVSAAAAGQLVVRGRRGLAGRLTQVHAAVPEHLAPALRAAAIPMPANLAEIVAGTWGSLATGAGARLAPFNLWLTEHAVRPLQVTVVGLIGLGVIGLGLVGEGTTVNTPQVAAQPTPVGSLPSTSLGGGTGTGPGSPGGVNNPGPVLNISPGAGTTGGAAAAATTGTAAATTAIGSPAGTATPATTAPHTSVTSGPTGATTTPSTSPGSKVTTPTTPITSPTTTPSTAPATKTVVNLAPVASVTQTAGATTINVLPSTSPTTTPAPVSVTLGCSTGLGLTVGSITVGCPAPKATTSTTAPSSGGLLGTILPGL